tara:strand:- start:1094 stop:1198 length:105 start_codon:yes stop_codon:yes gene_type:complete
VTSAAVQSTGLFIPEQHMFALISFPALEAVREQH